MITTISLLLTLWTQGLPWTAQLIAQPQYPAADVGRQNPDCVRGAAEPILKKKVFPKAQFQLQKDKITGIETLSFANGDRLIIHNMGCEYYVLTFRFETARFAQAPTQRAAWFRNATQLMQSVLPGIDAPIDIAKGVKYLTTYIKQAAKNNYQNLKLGEEIYFNGEDMRSYVTVDKIEKLPGGKSAVELSFVIGPL